MRAGEQPVFLTLGPAGTNHELVTRNYLAFRGLAQATIRLIDDFFEGLVLMALGDADFMVQVAVHPDCADVVAAAHFQHRIYVVDTFISPSKPLGILTRIGVDTVRSIGVQPATTRYADLSRWSQQVPVPSIARIAEGLLNNEYDSGLTTLELAQQYPDRFRVDARIGTVDDPWIVLGKQRVCAEGLVAWPDSPVVAQFGNRSVQD